MRTSLAAKRGGVSRRLFLPRTLFSHPSPRRFLARAHLAGPMYAGFVLESEPSIPELQENYVMVFRPMTPEELGRLFEDRAGAGWA